MILLADRLDRRRASRSCGLLDITVERNAYGRQLDSFEADLDIPSLGDEPLHGVFIRAPVVSRGGRERRGPGARRRTAGRSPCARAA